MKKPTLKVEILGTGVNVTLDVTAHEILGLPAGTYHKLTFADGTISYWNDFGIKSVTTKPI